MAQKGIAGCALIGGGGVRDLIPSSSTVHSEAVATEPRVGPSGVDWMVCVGVLVKAMYVIG